MCFVTHLQQIYNLFLNITYFTPSFLLSRYQIKDFLQKHKPYVMFAYLQY